MILRATERDMYKLMDYKETCLIRAGICIGGACICTVLLACRGLSWEPLYLVILLSGTALFLFREAIEANDRIMQTKDCYMELESDCLVVRQPQKKEHYEACRIFFDEIEKIVEGSKGGEAEFYVVIRRMKDQDRKSFILFDDTEKGTRIFQVRSFGYKKEEFQKLYRKLRWEVPGRVRIFGTRKQSAWFRKKKGNGWKVLLAAVCLYGIPKAFLLLL